MTHTKELSYSLVESYLERKDLSPHYKRNAAAILFKLLDNGFDFFDINKSTKQIKEILDADGNSLKQYYRIIRSFIIHTTDYNINERYPTQHKEMIDYKLGDRTGDFSLALLDSIRKVKDLVDRKSYRREKYKAKTLDKYYEIIQKSPDIHIYIKQIVKMCYKIIPRRRTALALLTLEDIEQNEDSLILTFYEKGNTKDTIEFDRKKHTHFIEIIESWINHRKSLESLLSIELLHEHHKHKEKVRYLFLDEKYKPLKPSKLSITFNRLGKKEFCPVHYTILSEEFCYECKSTIPTVKIERLTDISLHRFRGGFISKAIELGMTPHQVASLSGHESIQVLNNFYVAADRTKLARDSLSKIAENW